jgi:hypothetical protein
MQYTHYMYVQGGMGLVPSTISKTEIQAGA